jgi:hypothetical protein
MTGIEFLEVWKADAHFRRVPVIIVSGNADRFQEQLKDLTPYACRSKPIDFDDLLALVKAATVPR